VGGGLLGLEAAAGLRGRGVGVTVVELAGHVMSQQLDAGAARILRHALEAQGIACITGRGAARIEPGRVVLDDGSEIAAARVVVAAGVRAETALARAAGLQVERGIVVDDALRTSAPGVYAVGECAEHDGTVYGLWAPLAEQARIAGAGIAGDPAAFRGASQATTLKISGIDVFAGGRSANPPPPGHDEIVHSDTRRGIYRRLVLDGDRLTGAALVGDTTAARQLAGLLRTGDEIPSGLLRDAAGAVPTPLPDDPRATVCCCHGVTVGELREAIERDGLETVADVGASTRATTGGGSCRVEVQELLAKQA
jgi:ferredoxin-nitrate reductase